MNIDDQLITYDDNATESSELMLFSLQDTASFWSTETLLNNDLLEKLVFQICRKPKCLITHIQRIYYCFQMHLDEQLFAALVDFLVILNKRGQAISRRMVAGSKSRLNSNQFKALNDYLKDDYIDINLISGNQFSVLSKGLVGINNIVQKIATHDELNYDPLALARDYIEYSQLEEAKQVLEKAILEQPTRLDLHHDLLAIYKSMRDTTRFNQMLAELIQSGVAVPDEWIQLNYYFKGQNNDG